MQTPEKTTAYTDEEDKKYEREVDEMEFTMRRCQTHPKHMLDQVDMANGQMLCKKCD